ncbi:MAG: hypothetical protein ACOYMN_25050, partial [Roseimicrobium sp.]
LGWPGTGFELDSELYITAAARALTETHHVTFSRWRTAELPYFPCQRRSSEPAAQSLLRCR